MMEILKVADKKQEKVLRTPLPDADYSKLDKKELKEMISRMRVTMKNTDGVGLAATQIGSPIRMFVAEVAGKFYAIINPHIIKTFSEKVVIEEGCLSVPGIYGDVERPDQVILKGLDRNGKPVKIKAWGLLARVFQHEVDHLNGTIFIDKAKGLHEYVLEKK